MSTFETRFAAVVANLHAFIDPADSAFFTDVMNAIRAMNPQDAIAYKNAMTFKYGVKAGDYRISFNSTDGCTLYYA